jgi:hypothetical protein
MLGGRWNAAALGRVNPYVPLAVIAAGGILLVAASRPVGIGVAVGAVLAFVNMLLLSGRVEVAADTGDMARAMLVMQIGLITTFAIIAVVTVVLVHFSVSMAVAAAGGFIVAHLGMLAAFYWTRGRNDVAAGRHAS